MVKFLVNINSLWVDISIFMMVMYLNIKRKNNNLIILKYVNIFLGFLL